MGNKDALSMDCFMLVLQEETKLVALTKLRNDTKKLNLNQNMECACCHATHMASYMTAGYGHAHHGF
jgi:hypothetical protein